MSDITFYNLVLSCDRMNGNPPVLSVGSDIGPVGDSASWINEYNIKAYEHVFLDYYSLGKAHNQDRIKLRPTVPDKDDILRFVRSGNQLYILLPESNQLVSEYGVIQPDQIFYGDLSLIEEKGKYVDLENVGSEWKWYFDDHFQWHIRLGIQNRRFEIGSQKFEWYFKPIVTNPAGEPLSWEATYSQVQESSLAGRNPTKDRLNGRIFFIPVIKHWTPSELISSIIGHRTNITVNPDEQNKPDWTSEWALPEEREVRERASDIENEIQSLTTTLEELEIKIDEFEHYKNLLWGNEGVLERLIPSVFEELGFDVKGEESHGPDGMICTEDTCFVLEIFGTKNDISDYKYRQLLDWVGDVEAQNKNPDKEYTGLLVANPRRLDNPESRNPDEYFPKHLRKKMEQKGFKLLLTPTLYEMLVEYRKDNLRTKDIRRALLSDELTVQIEYP